MSALREALMRLKQDERKVFEPTKLIVNECVYQILKEQGYDMSQFVLCPKVVK